MEEYVKLSLKTYDEYKKAFQSLNESKRKEEDIEKVGYDKGFNEGLELIQNYHTFIKFIMNDIDPNQIIKATVEEDKTEVQFMFTKIKELFYQYHPDLLIRHSAEGGIAIIKDHEKTNEGEI